MDRRGIVRMVAGAAISATVALANARAQGEPTWFVGAAPFLTRDPGWNFEMNVALSGGAEWRTGAAALRTHATVRFGSRGNQLFPAIYPPRPRSTENGFGFGVHGLWRRGPGYLFAGPEYNRVAWETDPVPAQGGTWVMAGGIGLGRGRWAAEGRYGAFARRLGTTRGQLDVGVVRRFGVP